MSSIGHCRSCHLDNQQLDSEGWCPNCRQVRPHPLHHIVVYAHTLMTHPFHGETMVCLLCGEVKVVDPFIASNWYHLVDPPTNIAAYYCSKHSMPEIFQHFGEWLKEAMKERQETMQR